MSSRALLLCCLAGVLLGVAAFAYRSGPIGWRTGAHAPARSTATDRPVESAASYHAGVMRAAPSVVSVYASHSQARRGSSRRLDTSQGSGVIVSADGLVVTNLHLIAGAEVINVVLADGRSLIGERIGADAETDLAVIRVRGESLPALSLDAAATPRVGDIVLAIGNPFGVGQTVTQGIVSATGRRVAGGSVWQDFIQIDAAINPGNSGGALIDSTGTLVGVNTAAFLGGRGSGGDARPDLTPGAAGLAALPPGGARGIGYAIPADVLQQVVPALVARGRVERGWLGVGVEDGALMASEDTARRDGILITDVMPRGPADRAGLLVGDLILTVDARPVDGARALLLDIAALPPGSEVRLNVERDGETRTVMTRLGERPGRGAPRRAEYESEPQP